MYLGYIVGEEHPLLKTISKSSIQNQDKPVLIVGMNRAINLFPNTDVFNKKIEENIYYCFSKTESEKSEESLNSFLFHCYKNLTEKFQIEKKYLEFNNIVLSKDVFIYETDFFITITSEKTIYYIDKKVYKFFNSCDLNTKKLIKKLKKNNPSSFFYSWSDCFYFQSYLKTIDFYMSLSEFKLLHSFTENIDLYIGGMCLEWLKELKRYNISEKTLQLWNKAYEVDEYLSSIKVRIDKNKFSELEDNSYYKILKTLVEDNYIKQSYNGTDKLTGRIYASGNFSLQTLAEKDKNLIIPEPNCLLIEFDYDYFEYSLLRQICNLEYLEDPHKELSLFLFKDVKHRDIAKSINYSIIYGKSIENTISDIKNNYPNLKIKESILYEKLTMFVKPYSELQEKLEKELKTTHKIYNYFGRNIYPDKNYACLNNYIQSTAADYLIRKIFKAKGYLKNYTSINKILLQKHDSILFNLSLESIENTNIVEDIIKLLEEEENSLFSKVSFKFGKNWKELK